MTDEVRLVEQLKKARTTQEIARLTAHLLRFAGIYNFQAVAHELARMCVTDERE